MNIIQITSGELPSANGLHGSQVLNFLIDYVKIGNEVHWVSFIPILPFLKKYKKNKKNLVELERRCGANNIKFKYFFEIYTINGVFSFPFRMSLLKYSAMKLVRYLHLNKIYKPIIHGRSYYASEIACIAKARLNNEAVSSFDMRSLSPEELPLTRGKAGLLMYGFAKNWEAELLRRCDVSFLGLDYGRFKVLNEIGVEVIYAPIRGLSRPSGWTVNFNQRWEMNKSGYSGSIGQYQNLDLILLLLKIRPSSNPSIATNDKIDAGDFIDIKSYPVELIHEYYEKLLYLVIPGTIDDSSFYSLFSTRCNLFSTKAAEALSLGVPIVVSSHLNELVDFVRKNDCGVVYDFNKKLIVHPSNFDPEDKNSWKRLTDNAVIAGDRFLSQNVNSIYLDAWKRKIPEF